VAADRDRVLALLRRFGHHATSFQILEEGFTYWFDDEAVVGFVEVGRFRVVAGAPICAPGQAGVVATRFLEDCSGRGSSALFFCADALFLDQLGAADVPFCHVQIGEQPEWVPGRYALAGPLRRSLRSQVNRARNKGVEVSRLSPDALDGTRRAQVEGVLADWLASRRMGVMRFMVDLQPFSHAAERRYYLASHAERAVGFLAAIPVYGRRGWFLEDVIRVPDAPNGTTEMLIERALADARDAGDDYLTLGLAPLSGVETGPGPHRLLRRCFKGSWDHLKPLYDFAGIRSFKARFRPDTWAPQYLVASPPRLGVFEIHAVLRAFAGRGLLGFVWETTRRLARRPSPLFWALAAGAVVIGLSVAWFARP
jgi:phosphatidylglycerol lysyltransferase